MERLRQWCLRHERILLYQLVLCLFGIVYAGAAMVPPWREPTALDQDPVHLLPFVAAFIVPYSTAYVMPLMVLLTPYDRRAFRRLAAAYAVAIVAAGACFVAFPLAAPRAADAGEGVFGALVRITYALDASRNLFPSLHVAVSTLTAMAVGRARPSWRVPMVLWAALIAASTLLVRQHYVADVAGGIALALAVSRMAFPKKKRSP